MKFMVIMETVLMALFGAALGFLASYPIVNYFKLNPIQFRGIVAAGWEEFGIDPIMPTIVDFGIFAKHTLIILIITVLLAYYAIRKITKLKTVSTKK